ncbi:MAG: DUF1592 domain-containing protein [Planctomycetaceae bacterium]
MAPVHWIRSGIAFATCILAITAALPLRADEPPGDVQESTKLISSYFTNYCVDCHGADEQMAGIAVHQLESQKDVLEQLKTWERVLKMIQLGAMPPEDIDTRPTADESKVVAAWLEDAISNVDCGTLARPGRPTIQRLNRVEYNNTIRDLFGIDVTPADDFPSDDVGEGFDNIGGVLSISPLLMEKYLTAAEQVTAAIIDTKDYSVPQELTTESNKLDATHDRIEDVEGLRFLKQPGELVFEQTIPVKAEYEIHFDAEALPLNDQVVDFALKIDGEEVKIFSLKQFDRPKTFRRKIELSAQSHRFSFEYYGDDSEEDESAPPRLGIGRVVIRGPVGGVEPDYSEAHRRIVVARPHGEVSVTDAAVRVVTPLLRRVLRRSVTDAEISRYAGLTESVLRDEDMTWERAVAATVQAMLVSPDFLFRVEQDPSGAESERSLSDHELAARLSYFLWSSMPDEELFRVADQGQLRDPVVQAAQIRRMIQDDKSQALVDNFAAQWLNLRILERSQPDKKVFSEFDDHLRRDMLKETSLMFRSIMQQDLSVEELLSGHFTFVNKRLAAHYGMQEVAGDEFVRVSLDGTHRRGVLTHGSVLTLTSYARRTSPVRRGKWILENLFGDAPPPPPPNVPELAEAAAKTEVLSIREQMAIHRTNPVCASCHQVMDPLGLGLENFDGIGRWRDEERGQPVDASGELPGGRKFDGPEQLVEILLSRRDDFVRTLAEKMLIYATGRGLEYYDRCVIDDCVEHMSHHNNRFSSLVESIVRSDAFMKRGRAE